MTTKDQLREISNSSFKNLPSGVDLMKKINDGTTQKVSSGYLQTVKTQVTEGCSELIEIGARIRPLMVESKQIGWVRGLYGTERQRVSRWLNDTNEFIIYTLITVTSLSREEIEGMSSREVCNLVEVVKSMTEYDVSLYPYLFAFTTTMNSENLWHGQGALLTSFENRKIEMPDGKVMKVITPSEHARLWASLCVYREQAKVRLDANWNALLQVRPMAGKSVDPLAADLKKVARQLITDSMEPWESIVKVKSDVNLADGWAHLENLDSPEGMLQELKGMMANDKHEQLMAKFEKQQIDAAEERKRVIENATRRRGGLGVNEETIQVMTEAEVHQRELELKRGKTPTPVDRNKTEVIADSVERMKRYK